MQFDWMTSLQQNQTNTPLNSQILGLFAGKTDDGKE